MIVLRTENQLFGKESFFLASFVFFLIMKDQISCQPTFYWFEANTINCPWDFCSKPTVTIKNG